MDQPRMAVPPLAREPDPEPLQASMLIIGVTLLFVISTRFLPLAA